MPDTLTDAAPATLPERQLAYAYVPPEAVERVAGLVYPFLQRACEFSGGRFTPESVLPATAALDPNWQAQLWIAGRFGGGEPPTLEAVAVTCVSAYSTGLKVLEVVLIAGENRAWLQFEEEFARWARDQGCQRIQQIGRRGWARTLSDKWKQSAVLFERDLTDGQ